MPPNDILATFLIEAPRSLERAVNSLAGEGSTGTFVEVPGETAELKERFRTRFVSMTELAPSPTPAFPQPPALHSDLYHRARLTVAIPAEMGSDLTTVLASVFGNISEIREVSGVKLVELILPEAMQDRLPGPRFGVDGTRRLLNHPDGPIRGMVARRDAAITVEQLAGRVTALLSAGADFIIDEPSPSLVGPPDTFRARVQAVMAALQAHADHTGRQVAYAFNITADLDTTMRYHDIVADAGGTCAQVQVNALGVPAVSYLRRHGQLALLGNAAGHALFVRQDFLGMTLPVHVLLWRMVGVDQMGFFPPAAQLKVDATDIIHACLEPIFTAADRVLPVLGPEQVASDQIVLVEG